MTESKSVLEGHARALVETAYGADCGEAWECWTDGAEAVLLHELSLEPSEAVVDAFLDAWYPPADWRETPNGEPDDDFAAWLREDTRAALRASNAKRLEEITERNT